MINKINNATGATIGGSNFDDNVHICVLLEGLGETTMELKLSSNMLNSQLYKTVLDQFFDSAHVAVEPFFYTISLLQANGQEVEISHEGYVPINTLATSNKIIVRENVNGVFDF